MCKPTTAIVDLRSADAFRSARPAGAVRLSHEDVVTRSYLLPPRHVPLVLVGGSAAHAAPVLGALRLAGRQVEHHPGETWRERFPPETGPPNREQLWQAATVVVRAARYRDRLPGRRAVDLACGSGRNAVYLAQRGFDVTAVDVAPDALARARDLASRHGVSIRTLQRDLEADGALDGLRADLIVVVRFLERALFAKLQRVLTPGGVLAYETFTEAQARRGHPRQERFLLKPNELRLAFPELEPLDYEEGDFDQAHLARLLARRPSYSSFNQRS